MSGDAEIVGLKQKMEITKRATMNDVEAILINFNPGKITCSKNYACKSDLFLVLFFGFVRAACFEGFQVISGKGKFIEEAEVSFKGDSSEVFEKSTTSCDEFDNFSLRFAVVFVVDAVFTEGDNFSR